MFGDKSGPNLGHAEKMSFEEAKNNDLIGAFVFLGNENLRGKLEPDTRKLSWTHHVWRCSENLEDGCIQPVFVSPMVVVKYLGYTVNVAFQIPNLSKGQLVYGSEDGGTHVHDDDSKVR